MSSPSSPAGGGGKPRAKKVAHDSWIRNKEADDADSKLARQISRHLESHSLDSATVALIKASKSSGGSN